MSLLLRVRGALRVPLRVVATAQHSATLGSRGAGTGRGAALAQPPWAPRHGSSSSLAMRAFSASATPSSSPSAAATTTPDSATRDALVEQLRPLCSSLYSEHRASQTVAQLVAAWEAQISALLQQHKASPLVSEEVTRTYEQGVAIALKQREFDLAEALTTQMKALGLAGHDALYVFQIRAVPLQWVSRAKPLSLDELRALELGKNWESRVLELVRTEEQPHHRKSPAEREQFHAFVRDGVAKVLAAYERDVPSHEQRIAPYNAAVRAYAANGLPFAQMLRVLNAIPQDSSARRTLNAETFLALLQGARWNDIPLTLERLAKSNVLRELQRSKKQSKSEDGDAALRRSRTAALLWDQTMRAITNSYNDRFFDKRAPLDKRRIRDLQAIFLDVEAQLLRVFPDKKFATIEDHTAVYEIRVKAAALLGLPRQVHGLLNEYKALAPVEFASGALGTSVFFKALEIFPSVGLKRVNAHDIERARALPEVLEAPEIAELKRTIENLETNVIPAKKAVRESGKVADTDPKFKAAGRELRKAQQTATKLKKRLHDTTSRVAVEVAQQQRLRAADRAVEIVLERLAAEQDDKAVVDPRKDLDVAVAIMTQYMTTANRFATRMNQHTRETVASEIMRRVFELLDTAVGSDVAPNDDVARRAQVEQLFSLATKTAALFWCEEDLERLMRRKKAALGTTRLDAEDYDRLVFMRVAQLDIDGACTLLQEMHFAGTSPTPTTIHRVVTGVLHKLYRSRGGNKKPTKAHDEAEDDDDDDLMDMEDDDGDDDEDAASATTGVGSTSDDEDESAASWTSGPSRLEDVASFIQEWYNLYRVKPMAKTVVPVFARLLASNNVWEVKRLLQILDAMDGGLSPVTEFWLEKRLAAVGKRVDDLRVTPKHR